MVKSSLIKDVAYNFELRELYIFFHNQDWKQDCTHLHVSPKAYNDFINAESIGKYYLNFIEPIFSKLKNKFMPRKSDKILNLRIDVTKINKDWLFKGEKGTYLDLTVFYMEEPDDYSTNGMVTQSVPKKIWEDDKNARGTILGNVKDFASQKREVIAEAQPNSNSGTLQADYIEPITDDLPFSLLPFIPLLLPFFL